MRRDVFVDNDSGGFSLLSSAVLERVIEDGRQDDRGFVDRDEVILHGLVGDDSFPARVVVGEPLAGAEADEWVTRARRRLKVPCGRLLLCGGFDPDCLADWREAEPRGRVRAVDVPPGDYVVDVYFHAASMAGRVLSERWPERLGPWFRREHPGAPFPSWLAALLRRSSEGDPGHEAAWRDLKAAVGDGRLPVDTSNLGHVGCLVHLQTADEAGAEPPTQVEGDGWLAWDAGARAPARCPLGVPCRDGVVDDEVRSCLGDLLALAPPVAEPPGPEPADLGPAVDAHPLEPVRGGPVELPLDRLHHLFTLGWWASDDAHPELLLAGAPAPPLPRGLGSRPAGAGVAIGLPPTGGKWVALDATRALAGALAGALPDGATLELRAAAVDVLGEGDDEPEDDDEPEGEPLLGPQRFRGVVRGGRWAIASAAPAVEAATLRDALALAAAAHEGRGLACRDAAEAAGVEKAAREWAFLLEDAPLEKDGLTLRLPEPAPRTLLLLAVPVFRARHGATWRCARDEDDDEGGLAGALEALGAASGRGLATPSGEVVLEGRAGAFRRGDLAGLRGGVFAADVQATDATLASLGFTPLGDVVCDRAADVVLRGWVDRDRACTTWAALLRGALGQRAFDLVTALEDGTALTTTTKDGPASTDPARVIDRHPDLDPVALLGRHRARLTALSAKHGPPPRVEPTLRALCEAVDASLARQLGPRPPG